MVAGDRNNGAGAATVQVSKHLTSQIDVRRLRQGAVEQVACHEHNVDVQPVRHCGQVSERLPHLSSAVGRMRTEAAKRRPEMHI